MKSTTLLIRISPEQKAAITRLAVKMGFNTSEWVRRIAINPLQVLGRCDRKGNINHDIHPSQDLTRIENGINDIEKRGLK